jgi:hypothetical protein
VRAARLARLVLLLVLAEPPLAAGAQEAAPSAPRTLPATSLAVRVNDVWQTWWSAARAPARWHAARMVVERAVEWRRLRPGLERGELLLGGGTLATRFRVLLVRLDPAEYRLRLRQATRDYGLRGAWSLDSASADAVLALNAGQFEGGDPWGWLMLEGHEQQPPGTGSLALGVVLDGGIGVALLDQGELAKVRQQGGVREGFQSYPTLLEGDGEVPAALRAEGRGIDVEHRDARLALGLLRDGHVLIALTRYGALGDALQNLPVGPTTPEMAALMGALGCYRAVMLDGGLSSQLLLRDAAGLMELWPGLRRVPLALEAVPRR